MLVLTKARRFAFTLSFGLGGICGVEVLSETVALTEEPRQSASPSIMPTQGDKSNEKETVVPQVASHT